MRRKDQFGQEARHLVQAQTGYVGRPAVFNNLADVPLAQEGSGEIEPIGALDGMFRWRDNCHSYFSAQRVGSASTLLLHRDYTTFRRSAVNADSNSGSLAAHPSLDELSQSGNVSLALD